jgi:choline dehydrogenase-like flavoprotein
MKSQGKEYDFIVVGSGPGGATVAKELSIKKKKVLILEWGNYEPLKGSFAQGFKTILIPGKSMLFTPQNLALVRGITTGGSSVLFYATSFPVPIDMLLSHGIDIREEVKELRTELPVDPLKDEMVGPMARRVMDSAQSLGYQWEKLDKFMFQDRWKPEYAFGHYGDPYHVKWSARMYVDEALVNGAEIINYAKVDRVIFEGKKAIGIAFKKANKKHQVLASKVVISAGGIGTPVILRASGIKKCRIQFFL